MKNRDEPAPTAEEVLAGLGIIVLAGGRSSRMGADKAQVRVDGRRLVDRVLAGLPADVRRIVVSPQELGMPTISEEPAFGGPVAGIAAGLGVVESPWVAVLAVDAPDSGALLPTLAGAIGSADCAIVVNEEGFDEPLCSLWRRESLLAAIEQTGVRDVAAKAPLRVTDRVVRVAGNGCERDFDTPDELRTLGSVELGAAPN